MARGNHGKIYGAGCITTKQIGPGGNSYVYAEWYENGQRRSKSCGSAAKPESYRRARDLLRAPLETRIAALEAELASLRAALDGDPEEDESGARPAGAPPAPRRALHGVHNVPHSCKMQPAAAAASYDTCSAYADRPHGGYAACQKKDWWARSVTDGRPAGYWLGCAG